MKFWVAVLLAVFLNQLVTPALKGQNQNGKTNRGIVGQSAPQWDVSHWRNLPLGEKSINVNDYSGKVTYLYFFQSWCPGCHREGFPTLQSLVKKFEGDDDVAFVAIQTTFEGHRVNTAAKLKVMADRYDLAIPFGQSDGDVGTPAIMRKYRTGGTPWVVIIDRQGVVRFNDFHISPSTAVAKIEALKSERSSNSESVKAN